jgi:hypothetical protein
MQMAAPTLGTPTDKLDAWTWGPLGFAVLTFLECPSRKSSGSPGKSKHPDLFEQPELDAAERGPSTVLGAADPPGLGLLLCSGQLFLAVPWPGLLHTAGGLRFKSVRVCQPLASPCPRGVSAALGSCVGGHRTHASWV